MTARATVADGHDRRHGRRRSARGGVVATGFAAGTEVAELAGQLGVERVVERHGHGRQLPLPARDRLAGAARGAAGARSRRGRDRRSPTAASPLGDHGFHDSAGVRLTLPFSSISSTTTSIS